MSEHWKSRGKAVGLLCIGAATGCAAVMALEPISKPPREFRQDAVATVEFVLPSRVGSRCAQRGVKTFGMPAFNTAGCANTTLMTVPNPCFATGAGWYADLLCHELGHINGWPDSHPDQAFGRDTPLKPASSSPEAKVGKE